MKPCNDLCQAVDTECYGTLNLFSASLNCSDTTRYSSSSDPTVCNDMSNSTYVPSMTEEMLIPSNDQCSDVISDYSAADVFVPPAHKIGLGLSPLRSSYVVQSALNAKMAYILSAIPNWFSEHIFPFLSFFFGTCLFK